jgi:hypothetical protein
VNHSRTQRPDVLPDRLAIEAAEIAGARASRIQMWESLGLRVADDSLLFVIARANAAVDRCSDSSKRFAQAIIRCEERAGRAA